MKDKFKEYIGALNSVRLDVINSYTQEEMNRFKSFQDFFNSVDVMNTYEPEWEPNQYKHFYFVVWNEHILGKLKWLDQTIINQITVDELPF